MQDDILTLDALQINPKKRKELLPLWIKIFTWIFLAFGLIAPVGLIFGLLGYSFQISLYGLQTDEPLSLIGICLIILFLLKGIIAFGLLREKDWAVTSAITDAIAGIAICIFVMIYPAIMPTTGVSMNLRLELVALIPYLLKMKKIKPEWENNMLL